jgi:predicted nucleotidyltransferase component of viral defense system
MSKDLGASVRARLLNIAKEQGADFNQVLVRFALERLLYRLSQSEHADRFLLKGALLFTLWYDMPHRSTRDADLLGFGPNDLDSILQTFRQIASVTVDDAIVFDPDSVTVEPIRRDARYSGVRIMISSELANARCRTQVDVGFGDAVTPGPVHATYPVLLSDFPAPRLRTYPVYTVIAEKLHAIASIGMANTRMKDYLDLWVLLDREKLNRRTLARAIAATFTRRSTVVPVVVPIGLSDEFGSDPSRQALWKGFLAKNELAVVSLLDVVVAIRSALQPAMDQAVIVAAERGTTSGG